MRLVFGDLGDLALAGRSLAWYSPLLTGALFVGARVTKGPSRARTGVAKGLDKDTAFALKV